MKYLTEKCAAFHDITKNIDCWAQATLHNFAAFYFNVDLGTSQYLTYTGAITLPCTDDINIKVNRNSFTKHNEAEFKDTCTLNIIQTETNYTCTDRQTDGRTESTQLTHTHNTLQSTSSMTAHIPSLTYQIYQQLTLRCLQIYKIDRSTSERSSTQTV